MDASFDEAWRGPPNLQVPSFLVYYSNMYAVSRPSCHCHATLLTRVFYHYSMGATEIKTSHVALSILIRKYSSNYRSECGLAVGFRASRWLGNSN